MQSTNSNMLRRVDRTIMPNLSNAVAVVGLACRFPGSENVEQFWETLVMGKNHITEIPKDRWRLEDVYDSDHSAPGKAYSKHGGFINITDWDAAMFGISKEEAKKIDPQQLLLLEMTYKALEHGGFPLEKMRGSNTSVFVGTMNDDFGTIYSDDHAEISAYASVGQGRCILANRLSFFFDLRGPSNVIDTACSSGLIAVNHGIMNILTGISDMAICAGVNLMLNPGQYIGLSKSGMASEKGQCQAFSEDADGYVRSEGCGVVILKSINKAIANGDKIYALISARENQDGNTAKPITSPSMEQHRDLLRQTCQRAGIDPADVQYVEAHGTGTKAGDPVEAGAIGAVYGVGDRPCLIGSVKTNIGHAEGAAGLASLIKVLLMMRHEKIVPSLHFNRPNKAIDFAKLNIKVSTRVQPWPDCNRKIAGVNSFGFGGSNCHVIVMEFVKPNTVPRQLPGILTGRINLSENNVIDNGKRRLSRKYPIQFSAYSPDSLKKILEGAQHAIRQGVINSENLAAFAYTSTCRRTVHRYRTGFVVTDVDDLAKKIDSAGRSTFKANSQTEKKIIFIFHGIVPIEKDACKELRDKEPLFNQCFVEIGKFIYAMEKWSMEKILGDEISLRDPKYAQPLLFAFQVALAKLLLSKGLQPDSIIGHSVGEVAAAVIGGKVTLETGTKIICKRGKALSRCSGGKMLAVGNIATSQAEKSLIDFEISDKVTIAAYNTENNFTLSGESGAIDKIKGHFQGMPHLMVKELQVNVAYHSHFVESEMDMFEKNISKSFKTGINSNNSVMYSTVTGKKESNDDYVTPNYWRKNVRQPVLFQQAVQANVTNFATFPLAICEIGPSPHLGSYSIAITKGITDKNVNTMSFSSKSHDTLCGSLMKAWQEGLNVTWQDFFVEEYEPTVQPQYSFNRQNFRLETKLLQRFRSGEKNESKQKKSLGGEIRTEPLGRLQHPYITMDSETDEAIETRFTTVSLINMQTAPFVFDHKLNGRVIIPGALYVDIGLASVLQSNFYNATHDNIEFCVTFERAWFLNNADSASELESAQSVILTTTFVRQSERENLTTLEFDTTAENKLVVASGWLYIRSTPSNSLNNNIEYKMNLTTVLPISKIQQRCGESKDSKELYSKLGRAGFTYGPLMHVIQEVYSNDMECLAKITLPSECRDKLKSTVIHPSAFDALLQLSALFLQDNHLQVYPKRARGVKILQLPGTALHLWAYVKVTSIDSDKGVLLVEGWLANLNADVLVYCESLDVGPEDLKLAKEPELLSYCNDWSPVLDATSNVFEGTLPKCLILAHDDTSSILKALERNSIVSLDRDTLLSVESDHNQFSKLIPEGIGSYDIILYLLVVHNKMSSIINKYNDRMDELVLHYTFPLCQLLKYMTDLKVVAVDQRRPIVVITQGVYGLHSPDFMEDIDDLFFKGCIGNSAWGTVRTLRREGGGENIRLIDMTYINDQELSLLQNELRTTGTASDISIVGKKVYAAEMNRYMTPRLRRLDTRIPAYTQPCCKLVHSGKDAHLQVVPTRQAEIPNNFTLDVLHVRRSIFDHEPKKNLTNTMESYTQCVDIIGELNGEKENLVQTVISGTVTTKMSLNPGSVIPMSYFSVKEPCLGAFLLAWYIFSLKRVVYLGADQDMIFCFVAIKSATSTHLLQIFSGFCSVVGVDMKLIEDVQQLNTAQGSVVAIGQLDDILWKLRDVKNSFKNIVLVTDSNVSVFDIQTEINRSTLRTNCLHVIRIHCFFEEEHIPDLITKFRKWLELSDCKNKNALQNYFDKSELNNPQSIDKFGQEVLDVKKMTNTTVSMDPKMLFLPHACYVIIGGTKGLGWILLQCMIKNGAKYVVSLSRSREEHCVREEANRLQFVYNCNVLFAYCDVAKRDELEEAFKNIKQQFKDVPLGGVINGAVVLEDTGLETMTQEKYLRALKPKVQGSWNLHCLTKTDSLDYFIMQSSIAAVMGNSGQTNYGTANAFMDALAQYRTKRGLAGRSLGWGTLSVGVLQQSEFGARRAAYEGIVELNDEEMAKCFLDSLRTDRAHVMYANLNWPALLKRAIRRDQKTSNVNYFARRYERFAQVNHKTKQTKESATNAELNESEENKIKQQLREIFADIIPDYDPDNRENDSIDVAYLGADSLALRSLQERMLRDFKEYKQQFILKDLNVISIDNLYKLFI